MYTGVESNPGDGFELNRKGQLYSFAVASLVAQWVKNLPVMQETWVQSLGWEGPLEKGKTTYSSILAWRIPGTVRGCQEST